MLHYPLKEETADLEACIVLTVHAHYVYDFEN